MDTMPSQITNLTIVYSAVYSGLGKKNQSSAPLAFLRGIHRGKVNSPHKWPVTRKMFPVYDVIMAYMENGSTKYLDQFRIYSRDENKKRTNWHT